MSESKCGKIVATISEHPNGKVGFILDIERDGALVVSREMKLYSRNDNFIRAVNMAHDELGKLYCDHRQAEPEKPDVDGDDSFHQTRRIAVPDAKAEPVHLCDSCCKLGRACKGFASLKWECLQYAKAPEWQGTAGEELNALLAKREDAKASEPVPVVGVACKHGIPYANACMGCGRGVGQFNPDGIKCSEPVVRYYRATHVPTNVYKIKDGILIERIGTCPKDLIGRMVTETGLTPITPAEYESAKQPVKTVEPLVPNSWDGAYPTPLIAEKINELVAANKDVQQRLAKVEGKIT